MKSYLMHHGILGQKWGVRRFEDKNGRLTAAGKERYGKGVKRDKSYDETKTKEKFWTEDRKAIAKEVAIGAAIVGGTAFAGYMAYQAYKDGKLDPIINKFRNTGETKVNTFGDLGIIKIDGEVINELPNKKESTGDPFLDSAKKEGIKTLDNVPTGDERSIDYIESRLKTMNPTGSDINCPGVCAVYDLQARGLDVCAQNKIYAEANMKEMYPDYKLKPVKSFEEFKSIAEKLPEGSRGELSAKYREEVVDRLKQMGGLNGADISKVSTFGHAYPWEIKNGKLILCNGQSDSHVYTDDEIKFIVSYLVKPDQFSYECLSNLKVDLEGVSIETNNVKDIIKEIKDE